LVSWSRTRLMTLGIVIVMMEAWIVLFEAYRSYC
jgi:hypothetical protein